MLLEVQINRALTIISSKEFEQFLETIKEETDYFTYTCSTVPMVISHLQTSIKLISFNTKIRTFRPKWRWSKQLGNWNGKFISINLYKSWSIASLVGFFVHEFCHVEGYHHGGNCISWYCHGRRKMKSVNYLLGRLSKEWVSNL